MDLRGTSVRRREDAPLLRGEGTFVGDIEFDNPAYVHYLTSTIAHAKVLSIETSAALSMPGVIDIVTNADLDIGPYPSANPLFDEAMVRPLLADDRVRFVGEPVVAIVAESPSIATDAAELIEIDYQPLDVVVDVEAALDSQVLLFDEAAEGNVVCRMEAEGLEADFASCEVVTEVRTVNNRLAPAPIETRVAAAEWRNDGRLHCFNAGQGPHPVRAAIASILGLDKEQVRVVSRDVGGSFGAKARPSPEEAILGWISKRVDRPVVWVPSRSDDMVGLGHGRGQIQYCRIGGTAAGDITAYHLHVVQEAGAYPAGGAGLPANARAMLTGCYDIPSVGFSSVSVVTNTTPTGAYRGAGRPEAAAAIERAVDAFAAEIGMDSTEVRRRNFLSPQSFPLTTKTGSAYDSGEYEASLDAALAASDYEALRTEQARRRLNKETCLLGIGVASYVERTAGAGRSEYGGVELLSGGKLLARTGSSPYGQGHHTAWAMLIADATGVAMDDIEVVHGDTDEIPQGGITGGSRSVQLAGAAIWESSALLVDQAKKIAADLLEASEEDLSLNTDSGLFHVVGTPSIGVSWPDIAKFAETQTDGPRLLHAEEVFDSEGPTFPFGTHVALIELDVETGAIELKRLIACDDAGVILNPLLADGQVHGGLAQGAAQALVEEFRYDEYGNPLTSNFADYPVISATELPMFERVVLETPTHINPLGAKGIGESGTVGATPAIQNAVIDALSHLGIRHLDMPLTPEKVWREIEAFTA
ncbi:MAG: xanthine dehydrogenase family protein molybdopterin-binding subunit [Candidatus Poriferisodalaceae bacterium]|nr:MAG: carbon monoxide dehydrogenase [Acidimicrobiales bacterium MED-G01]